MCPLACHDSLEYAVSPQILGVRLNQKSSENLYVELETVPFFLFKQQNALGQFLLEPLESSVDHCISLPRVTLQMEIYTNNTRRSPFKGLPLVDL